MNRQKNLAGVMKFGGNMNVGGEGTLVPKKILHKELDEGGMMQANVLQCAIGFKASHMLFRS